MLYFSIIEKYIGAELYKKLLKLKQDFHAQLISFNDLYAFLSREEKKIN